MTNSGNLSVNAGDTLSMEVGTGGSDEFVIAGSASLGGATLNLTTNFNPLTPPTVGTQFTLIDTTTGVTGCI